MQEVLTEFNRLLDDKEIPIELIVSTYSDIEMMEHSQYRELWIAQKCQKYPISALKYFKVKKIQIIDFSSL
jgi:hypothetical protein